MFGQTHWKEVACGRVNADGTTDGIFGASIIKGAAGLYTVRVFSSAIAGVPQGSPIAANRLMAFVSAIGAVPFIHAVNDVNDNDKLITMATNAGVLTDQEFCFTMGSFLPVDQ